MASKKLTLQEHIAFLYKLRLRAFAVLVGLSLAAVGVVSMVSAPVWPVVAGAVAIAAVVVNTVASRLTQPVCIGCGTVLDNQPVGQYGVVCPSCGTIASPAGLNPPAELAQAPNQEPDTASDTAAGHRA
ncbi:MAG: hypothetical protein AAGF47_03665 [Planctomycetota bacterium]